ncbi:MAG: single-stranded DNA-binding protein [Comamonadaceae bacterium]|nr:single-stranded DNA-binding protein [Comamonadaceae bacterium]
MSAPTVHVVGRLTAAPELRFTASGAAVASFPIAASDRRKTAAERMDELSRGTPLAAAIAARAAAKRLTQWADELTDTNDRIK